MKAVKPYIKAIKKLTEADAKLYKYAEKHINVLSPCNNCGYCCRNNRILVTLPEIIRILKFTEMDFDDVFIIEDNNLSVAIRKNDEGYCMFRAEGKCTIYPVRPFQCMTYPVLFVGFYRELPTFANEDSEQIYFNCESINDKKMKCSVDYFVFKRYSEQRYRFLRSNYFVQGGLIRSGKLKSIIEKLTEELEDKWLEL